MSMGDKIKHKAEEAKGRTKETVGDATDNPELQAEGRSETVAAKTKHGGDKVKDAAQDVKDAARDAAGDRDRDR